MWRVELRYHQWWWPSDDLAVMIQSKWWSRLDDDPVMIQIKWWSSDDLDLMMIQWCSRSSDDPNLMMIQWCSKSSDDPDLMKMTWWWSKWYREEYLCWENTFIVKRECWCICNLGMYILIYLMYCTPMFIPGSICNVIESCHTPMFRSRDSIM